MIVRLPLIDLRGDQERGALERAHAKKAQSESARKARANARAIAELWACRQLMARETRRMAR